MTPREPIPVGCACLPERPGLVNLPEGSPIADPPGLSRKFLFALRDALPVPADGLGVHLEDGRHIDLFDVFVPAISPATVREALLTVGEHLVRAPGPPDGLPTEGVDLTLALVMTPIGDPFDAGEHLVACLDLLEQTSRALLRATDASARPATSRRLYPWVVVLDRDADGTFLPVTGTQLPAYQRPTNRADAREAAIHLALDLEGDVMARYEDLWLSARRFADVDGDFTQAVLAAATASEFLVKQAAWALEWEASERGDPPVLDLPSLFRAGPGDLIGSVFTRRLRGNWNTQSCRHPAGAWRHHVAAVRNRIMHQGERADEWEALLAIRAEEALCGHVTEAVMARRSQWPRAANVLALEGGPAGQPPRHEELAAFRAWAAGYVG